jgi:NADH-quinone oxidoreductase subunit L
MMTIPEICIWLIWLLPLAAFALTWIIGWIKKDSPSAPYVIIATTASWLLSLWALINVFTDGNITTSSVQWLNIGALNVKFALELNPLSTVMLMVVNTVSLMVQIFSMGYMHGDHGYRRYFSFVALFTFSMLGLVLADSLLMLFMCWELVGLCSYLLIGFWFFKPSAASAAKKAFLITRIGDLGILAALIMLFNATGTFTISELHGLAAAGAIGSAVLTWSCLGLFLGSMGKSAQFPLHIWLPDAMEGPTPVSALIHAATMVAAGVFLIARMYPLFEAAPQTLTVVAWVGGITAIFAATIALVMQDIKKVLAYSTISQLGYMFVGLALGGVSVGMFHLFTHAFFKALLFLGAGSISHAVDSFDMRKMGGLKKAMPKTYWTFLIGSLSLAGIWPLSGFFSKEGILGSAVSAQPVLFVILLVTAGLTAFYMFRVIFKVFFGEYKGDKHLHESPNVMIIPLFVLAFLAIFVGWINCSNAFTVFVDGGESQSFVTGLVGALAHPLAWGSLLAAAFGILLAFTIYKFKKISAEKVSAALPKTYNLLSRKYYMDELIQDRINKDALLNGLFRFFAFFDKHVIDGLVNAVAKAVKGIGGLIRSVQNGRIPSYGLLSVIGLVVIVILMMVVK